MKRIENILALTVLSGLLLLPSCSKNELGPQKEQSDESSVMSMVPEVTGYSADVTKSSAMESVTLSVSKDRYMHVNMVKTCWSGETPDSGCSAKGALVNPDGSSPTLPTDKDFYVAAWDAGKEEAIIDEWTPVKYYDTEIGVGGASVKRNMWCTAKADGMMDEKVWFPGETKTFFAHSNVPESDEVKMVYDEDDLPIGMELTHSVAESAADQTDILIGYYSGDGKATAAGEYNGTARITFSHPLASVVLRMGEVEGVSEFIVKSIRMENVADGGTVTMTPENFVKTEPAEKFVWEVSSTTTNVSQTVNDEPETGEVIGEPFILVPQTLTETSDVRMYIDALIDGSEVSLFLPFTSVNLQAGYTVECTLVYDGHEGIQLWKDGPYWAEKNIGATKKGEVGWFFSWGNTEGFIHTGSAWKSVVSGEVPDKVFTDDFYEYTQGYELVKKNIEAGSEYDAASVLMGDNWRMPTNAELTALVSNTEQVECTRNGQKGYLFTGINTEEGGDFSSNSIFLPYSGVGSGNEHYIPENCGFYWSSTYAVSTIPRVSYFLVWDYSGTDYPITPKTMFGSRSQGCVIRAVENISE